MDPNKVALVTGGTRGIGYGIAHELASAGYNLILGYRENHERAQGSKAELEATYTVRVYLVAGPTGEEATVDAYFSCIDDNFGGKLTALVHNAGAMYGGQLPARPDENSYFQGWEAYEAYQGMYSKCFLMMVEKAIPHMEDGCGYIVAISGVGCNSNTSPSLPYFTPGTAKSSMEYMVRHYAKQLAPRRITCNTIIPGIIDTEAWEGVKGRIGVEGMESMVSRLVLMKRWGAPREVGGVVSFLCSEKAAFITGAALHVDGGFHLK